MRAGAAVVVAGVEVVDELHTGDDSARARSHLLLEVLTPIAKSWPSEWCLEANSLAIQVLGGYGYTRDFPVEQYWRDNRLNMIHEGTHGIQALDLLGRKVVMDGGAGLDVVREAIDATIARAAPIAAIAEHAGALRRAADDVAAATRAAWSTGVPGEALANATPYLQAFGHLVLAWIWLDVAICAAVAAPIAAIAEHAEALRRAADDVAVATRAAWSTGVPAEALANATPYLQAFGHLVLAWIWLDVATCAAATVPSDAQRGRLAACRYFFRYELPRIGAWLGVVASRDDTCRALPEESF